MLLIFLHNGIFEFSKLNPAAEYDFFKKRGSLSSPIEPEGVS